jgi:hypothetical protein
MFVYAKSFSNRGGTVRELGGEVAWNYEDPYCGRL